LQLSKKAWRTTLKTTLQALSLKLAALAKAEQQEEFSEQI
jgi:hypothetical protein